MQSLAALTREDVRSVRGILFDLDDTFLSSGVLTEGAYASLWRLSRAGLRLIGVTGRPSGWGQMLVRQWPVDAMVTENGAVSLWKQGHVISRLEEVDEAGRRARRIRLAAGFETLRAQFAEARLSDDMAARSSDLVLDIGESQRVPRDRIEAIVSAAHALGFRTYVSSVHLHLTLDAHDKASGVVAFLRQQYGEDATAARSHYAFIGDSGNDAACLAAFELTFGVANLREKLADLSVPPRFIASKERGAGFEEIADRLLALRA